MNRIDDPIAALGALDPIDAPALVADWTATAASAALLDALPGVEQERPPIVRRLRRNRRWIRTALAAGVAASAVTGLVLVGLPGSTPRAYGIRELQDGKIVFDVRAIDAAGVAGLDNLRDYGLSIDVEEEIASPSLVGEVSLLSPVGGPNAAHPDRLPPGIEIGPDGTDRAFTWTIDPAVFDTTLTARVNVAAKPGQRYETMADVFAPGERLAEYRCSLTQPLPASTAAALAEAHGLSVNWLVYTPTNVTSDGWEAIKAEPTSPPAGRVIGDFLVDAQEVTFVVRPPGDWPDTVQQNDHAFVAELQEGC